MLDYDCMKLDNAKLKTFKEYLDFKLSKEDDLKFPDLKRHIGISKQQFEIFCLENKEKLKVKVCHF